LRQEEARGIGELAGDAAAVAVERVQDMHEGIAGRVFGSIGPGSHPVRAVHDRIARGVYETVGGIGSAALRGGAHALAATRDPDAPTVHSRPMARIAIGALNGAFGDALARRGNALALTMTVRAGGRDVATDPAEVAGAFPDATARVAVFTHGLCETDDAWRIGAERCVPYGPRLQAELGYTPVYIRYNSGRHVSENGRELARLLGELVAGWPVPITELVLVGHSMGGLVGRSACHYGGDWVGLVRHVFTLGTPHRGAPLEQLANAAGAALALLPETRTFARALSSRSAGIKDLRYGYLVDEDWTGHDADAWLRRAAREIPFLPAANHYFVCATLTREPDAPVARIVGDLLVLHASAWDHGGRGERLRFPVGNYRHIGGATHFDLLNHPAIYDQIHGWLGERALPAPADPA
jgi:hypothetical protein